MNIKLGMFDIFSRIVPGVIYLAAFVHFAVIMGLISIDWQTVASLGLMESIGLIVVAYILGTALDRASLIWYLLFHPAGMSGRTLRELKEKYQRSWTIDLEDNHWPILLASIRVKNPDVAGEIDRYLAYAIMLRNISLGLVMLTVTFIIKAIVTTTISFLFVSVLLVIISILIVREGIRFRQWFYAAIFETTIAYQLSLEDHIKSVKNQKKTKSSTK